MRYLLLLLVFAVGYTPCTAQLPTEVIVTKYDETNGIDNGRVTAVLQGKNGYLWLGTTNGLVSYDGYAFRSYINSGLSNSITRLAEDSSHQIWMSFLGGGIASFNPATGQFANHKIQSAKDPLLGTGEIEMLFFDSKGQLWMGITQKGLVKAEVQQNKYTAYNLFDEENINLSSSFRKIYNSVYGVVEDAQGLLWLATHNGLYRFDPNTGKMSAMRDPSLVAGNNRLDLFVCMDINRDTLWMGGWCGGLSRYIITTGEWKTWLFTTEKARLNTSNIITAIEPRGNNEYWICSADSGLGTFNKQTARFDFFTRHPQYDNMTSIGWRRLARDKENNVWAIYLDGLVKVQTPDYKFVFNPVARIKDNASKNNYTLNDWWENEQLQLMAFEYADGLQVVDKKTGIRKALPVDVLPNEERTMEVRDIFQDSRKLVWVVTRDFIYNFDTLRQQLVKAISLPVYTKEKPSFSLTHVTEDAAGNLWFASRRNGVFKYTVATKEFTWYNNKEDAFHFIETNYVQDVATDGKGRIWIAGVFGILGYIDPKTQVPVMLRTGEGKGLKLPGTKSYSLLKDHNGNIWAGTYYGVCYFDCADSVPVLKKLFKSSNGLVSDFALSLQEDKEGNIWCVTEAGVCMIDHLDDHVSAYNARDGLTQGNTGQRMVMAQDGRLLLMANKGYFTIRANDLAAANHPVPLFITRMMVNDKEFFYQDILNRQPTITLQPDQNFFSFDFAAINFSRPDKQQYAYMLEGFDKDWVQAGSRRFVSYTNVPGGHYTFRVKLITTEGPGATSAIALPLYILTPFYKTIFFYLLLALIAGVLVYWLYRSRLKHHREIHLLNSKAQLLEKEKALVMYEGLKQQLNPHFLFNSLTSLSGLIQTNQQMADDFLSRMSKIYRYILQNRESDTVTLREEVKFVSNYIQLQQTRFKKGLLVNVNIDEDYDHRKIAPVILQNLVENAIKHNIIDTDTPLVIDIFCEEDYLVIRNNLQKKVFVETSNKQGLLNMKALYRYLTNKPVIVQEDSPYFTIKIPLL